MYDSRVPISAFAYAMAEHSKKMERERDEARKLAEKYRDNHCEEEGIKLYLPWEDVRYKAGRSTIVLENDKDLAR